MGPANENKLSQSMDEEDMHARDSFLCNFALFNLVFKIFKLRGWNASSPSEDFGW